MRIFSRRNVGIKEGGLSNFMGKWIIKSTFIKIFIMALCYYVISFLIGFIFSENIGVEVDHNIVLSDSPLYYLNHNLKSATYLLSGIFSFSLTTFWYLFINGFFLGVTFAGIGVINSYGVAFGSIIVHGVFEIPAIILMASVGLYPLYFIYVLLRGRKIKFIIHLKNMVSMIVLAVFLFAVAATLEAYVSPIIIEWMN